jgi:CBS-domain-containing membrane protein
MRPRREDYERALSSMNTFIDVSVDDLMTLAQRAQQFASRRVTKALVVERVMSTPAKTVHPQTALSEAAHILVTERISGLPVVDDENHPLGIITEADFLRALGFPVRAPNHNLWHTLESLFSHAAHPAEVEAPDDPVADFMARDLVTVAPDQDLHEVIELMKQHRVKRVVVCDAQRRVIGMVTRSDLVRLFFDSYKRRD